MAASKRQLTRFTVIFASGTFLSRITGLIRNIVWFSAIPTASLGPFLVAFKFPNMLRDWVGEGASNAAFIPVFSETIEKESEEAFREAVSAVMSAMLIILTLMTLLGIFLLPWILRITETLSVLTTQDGLAEERLQHMVRLAQWTFPYLFFIGMSVFSMGPLFTVKHYGTPSWAPMLLNIFIIAACWWLAPHMQDPAYALVIAVWAGGVAQMVVQHISLVHHTGVMWPNFHLGHPAIKTVFWLMVPVLIGQAAGEVNKLVDILFAAVLGDDKVKALFTANQLIQLPLSIFGIAVAAAILPTISRAAARKELDEVRGTLVHGLRQTVFLILPAMLGLIILREPVVRLLFERGHFSAEDTTQTATAVFWYALGLLSFVWVKVLVSGFYAMKNTKTPVIIASGSMLLNVLLNCVLVGPMGFRGLALATTISYTVNAAFLYVLLCERFGPLWDRAFFVDLGRIMVATVLVTVTAYGVHQRVVLYFARPESLHCQLVSVSMAVTAAAGLYIVLCLFLEVPELKSFLSLLSSKGSRRKRKP